MFSASYKLARLSNLKCSLPVLKQSIKVIYKVNCSECDDFYIGKTVRRLSTRLNEHKKDENSSLYKHSFLTDHIIDCCKPEILETLMHLDYVLKKASKSRITVLINP